MQGKDREGRRERDDHLLTDFAMHVHRRNHVSSVPLCPHNATDDFNVQNKVKVDFNKVRCARSQRTSLPFSRHKQNEGQEEGTNQGEMRILRPRDGGVIDMMIMTECTRVRFIKRRRKASQHGLCRGVPAAGPAKCRL